MKVRVYFTELVRYEVEIEADSIEDAETKVKAGDYDTRLRIESDRENQSIDDSEEID